MVERDTHSSPLPQAGEGDVARSLSRLRERARVRARELRHTSTDVEHAIWQRLRSRQLGGYKFRRQHPIAGHFADFACIEARLVVELDGGQHFESDTMRADELRSARLLEAGFHVMRFDNRQALSETDAVLSAILGWLVAHHPHPNPLPPAGEGAAFSKD
jgi:very-short-patch-repair endonuclease